jgi:hypothetical protein
LFPFTHARCDSHHTAQLSTSVIAPSGLVIIGMRGAGKTTFGRHGADCLGFEFTDLDAVIEAAVGPIPDYVAANG